MPVEEIVLSLPEEARERDVNDLSESQPTGADGEQLIRHYHQLLKQRRRFAWTRRARRRREEVFDSACKSLAKQLARESTAEVASRVDRLHARTRIYAAVGGLLNVSALEAQRATLRNHYAVRYALLLGLLAGVSLAALTTLSLEAGI
jgi:hypothetical protein